MPLTSYKFSQSAAAAARATEDIFSIGDDPQHIPLSDNSGFMNRADAVSTIDANFSYSSNGVDEDPLLADISLGPVEFETQEIPDVDMYDSEMQTLLSLSNELADVVRRGSRHVQKMYSYRGCTSSIPQVAGQSQARGYEIHYKVYEALRPRVELLHEVTEFKDEVKQMIRHAMEELASDSYRVIPSHIGRLITQLLDVALQIDTIKDVRAGMKNEMSQFKRSFAQVRGSIADSEVVESKNQSTQQFINTPGVFLDEIQEEMKETEYKPILRTLMGNLLDHVKRGYFASPTEKHQHIRGMAVIFTLLDDIPSQADKARKGSVFVDQELDLNGIYSIFKAYPVVPLVWDIPLQLKLLLRRAKSGSEADLENALGSTSAQRDAMNKLSVVKHSSEIDEQHKSLSVRLASTISTIRRENIFGNKLGSDLPGETPPIVKQAWDLVVEMLTSLSSWSALVLEEAAVKHVVLGKADTSKSPYVEYERAIKNNYSNEEKAALIDVIGKIKSTSVSLLQSRNELDPVLRLRCHTAIQWFAHGLATDQMTKALRQDDKKIYPVIKRIRTIAAEWSEAFHGDCSAQENEHINLAQYKKKGSTLNQTPPHLPSGRAAGLHFSQNYSLRTALELLVDPSSQFMEGEKGFLSRKKPTMREGKIQMFRDFNRELSFFGPTLELAGSIRHASNLGSLWFRETYVERCKVVQFPIETSLPWILIHHCISTGSVLNSFHVLDLYNDAFHTALYTFRKKFLVDELEAEVNLAFDQFTYLVSLALYSNVRTSTVFDSFSPESKKHWAEYTSVLNQNPPSEYELALAAPDYPKFDCFGFLKTVLNQPNISLLGRNIDFSRILTHQINKFVREDIEKALETFEQDIIVGIVDYDLTIDILRRSHNEFSEFLYLDDFNVLLEEAEVFLSPYSGLSRSLLHLIEEIGIDLLPYFAYAAVNRRFTRTGGANVQDEIGSNETMLEQACIDESRARYKKGLKMHSRRFRIFPWNESKALGASTMYLRNFFGSQHVSAILRVCGSQGVARIVNELIVYVKELLKNDFDAYLSVLLEGLPPATFARYDLGAAGAYGVYEMKAKQILEYEDLKPCVFQMMRKIGNAIALANLFDSVLARNDLQQYHHVYPFIFPPLNSENDNSEDNSEENRGADVSPIQRISRTSAFLSQHGKVDSKYVYPQGTFATATADCVRDVYSSTKYPVPLAAHVLHSLAHMLYEEPTYGEKEPLGKRWASNLGSPSDEMFIKFAAGGNNVEFHRLWSVLFFIFCMPTKVSGTTQSEEDTETSIPGMDYPEYGDGFLYAGALLLRLLNQWSRFSLYDWTSHMLNVSAYEADEVSAGAENSKEVDSTVNQDAALFTRTAQKSWPILEQAYVIMSSQLPSPLPGVSTDITKSSLKDLEFEPPEEDDDARSDDGKFVVT